MIASSQIFEFIAALYSISMRLFMGTRERRVNVGRQISSFQLPPPRPPRKTKSNTKSAEPLQSCTLKSNDWLRQFIAKKICLDQGETTELFEALWHARHVISVHLLYFETPSPLTPWLKWSDETVHKTQKFAPTFSSQMLI